jgi:hypothetical protein
MFELPIPCRPGNQIIGCLDKWEILLESFYSQRDVWPRTDSPESHEGADRPEGWVCLFGQQSDLASSFCWLETNKERRGRGSLLYTTLQYTNCLTEKLRLIAIINLQSLSDPHYFYICHSTMSRSAGFTRCTGSRIWKCYTEFHRPGFDPRQRQRILLLASASRPPLGPTQPPVQWVPRALSPGVKRDQGVMLTTHPHLVPRLRMSRSYTSSHPKRLHGV